MHYERTYAHIQDRKAKDAKAIDDIREYCWPELWDALLVESGACRERGTAEAFQQLNIAMAFAGISGFPVHAWGRKHCLAAYRAWMADGKNGVATDDQGFPPEASS